MRTALLDAARQFGEIAPEFAFEKKGYWSWRRWRRRLSEETVVAPLQYAETVQALEVTITMLVRALYVDANQEKKPPNALEIIGYRFLLRVKKKIDNSQTAAAARCRQRS